VKGGRGFEDINKIDEMMTDLDKIRRAVEA
jgi:hypothetical protein